MTALNQYQRLEASGLWRDGPEAQRRDVIVSIGDATLVITDMRDQALTHWSLPAVVRANPGKLPAIYHPDGDPGETLELAEGEADMIEAIETVRQAIERRRPKPGRLRAVMAGATAVAVVALGVFWLPGAVKEHALSVVPQVKRDTVGRNLLAAIQRVSGPPCGDGQGPQALAKMAARLPGRDGAPQLVVLRQGIPDATHLPGNIILLNRSVIEDYEEPDVAAGYVIAEHLRARSHDPLRDLLDYAGPLASFNLLLRGKVGDGRLEKYAEHLLTTAPHPLSDDVLLAGFTAWGVAAAPYAYALDVTGEKTLHLIEADPFPAGAPDPVLPDADWLRLQAICGA
ncbi:hypothetical protein [Pseudooceanicola nanhaiensis]|uniref:hypothetical protein n=1 Tax=Pseudooceanicola nanhaiensis TaxID=375761 RepID=UPI001CD453EC|nr:hypothetical protein [Pseudooceanicola nanhaiensis]MCA0922252.1 hypothetical protein [Pseudooceanicola nanhaiensis]